VPDDFEEIAQLHNLAIIPFERILSDIEKRYFTQEETVQSIAEQFRARSLIAVKYSDKIVGYAFFRQKNSYCFWISSMYVHPGYQRQGIGKHLLYEIEQLAKRKDIVVIGLETHEKATWAIDFYAKNNYECILNKLDRFPFCMVLDTPPVKNRCLIAKAIIS